VNIARAILDDIDWEAVYRRLTVYAFSLVRCGEVLDGISADDLVGETVLDFLCNELTWEPEESTLDRYLCGALRNKYLQHLRRNQRSLGPVADDRLQGASQNAASGRTRGIAEGLKLVARGDRKLEELVEAAEQIANEGKVNQQLSEILKTTTEDIVNRKKRIARRLRRLNLGKKGL
jgi:DNA-directed RNA polymerase specialized sigma24 family protein